MGRRELGRWLITTGVTVTLCVGVTGYMGRRAHADGISAMNPMNYAGTLQNAGVPASGSYSFLLTVWSDPTSTSSSDLQCTTIASGVTVTNGRFRIPLDNSCTTPVHNIPDLWVDVNVSGTELGRTKMGAVPYAVEAARAASLSPSAAEALVPSGTIVAFGGTAAPTGWLLCDGSAVSQTTYAPLYAAIGTGHGSGGGPGMFNLPDYRGRFLRGVDNGAGRDPDTASRTVPNVGGNPGNAVGSIEAGQIASHAHGVTDPGHTHSAGGATGANFMVQATVPGSANCAPGLMSGASFGEICGFLSTASGTTGVTIQSSGGTETRPVNAYVNWIIKI